MAQAAVQEVHLELGRKDLAMDQRNHLDLALGQRNLLVQELDQRNQVRDQLLVVLRENLLAPLPRKHRVLLPVRVLAKVQKLPVLPVDPKNQKVLDRRIKLQKGQKQEN